MTWEESHPPVGRQTWVPALDSVVAVNWFLLVSTWEPLVNTDLKQSLMEDRAFVQVSREVPILCWSKKYKFECTGEGKKNCVILPTLPLHQGGAA